MIQRILNFLAVAGFTLLLPFFCLAAWFWGSRDERWLMKIAFLALSPLCACIWYVLLSHLIFKRRSNYFVQFLIVVLGYVGIALAMKLGMVTFEQ